MLAAMRRMVPSMPHTKGLLSIHLPQCRQLTRIPCISSHAKTPLKPENPARMSLRCLSSEAASSSPPQTPRSVGYWLIGCSSLVFGIVVVGGITRLTESGLSITEWKPITGAMFPTSHAIWVQEFEKYSQSPEFKMYVCLHGWQPSC
jgi:hypothetical protein